MNDFCLRPAEAQDMADIAEIWTRSFGDPPEFVRTLLSEAEMLSCTLCAEADGRVQSLMTAFDGIEFCGTRAAYLYALCTRPEARGLGMGTAVVRALAQRSMSRGAALVFLSPADDGMAAWYESILGAKPLSKFSDIPVVTSRACTRCEPVCAAEYYASQRGDVHIPLQLLTAQSIVHRFFGGSFFRVRTAGGDAFACAEPRDGSLLLRELHCQETAVGEVCASLAQYYGCSRVFLRKAVGSGSNLVYITSKADCKEIVKTLEISAFPFTME